MLQRATTAMLGLLLLSGIGCSTGQQQYSRQPIHEVPVVDNVRAWLNGVAESGELDSGAEIMRSEIDKLRSGSRIDVDTMLVGYDDLLKAKSPRQRKSKAKDLLGMLPS